jgi:hypothetical protein
MNIRNLGVKVGGVTEEITMIPNFIDCLEYCIHCAANGTTDVIVGGKGDSDIDPFFRRSKGDISNLPRFGKAKSCRKYIWQMHTIIYSQWEKGLR